MNKGIEDILNKFEPFAAMNVDVKTVAELQISAAISIAISLKRIADMMERQQNDLEIIPPEIKII